MFFSATDMIQHIIFYFNVLQIYCDFNLYRLLEFYSRQVAWWRQKSVISVEPIELI